MPIIGGSIVAVSDSEQEFGEVGAVLAGDAGDEGCFLHRLEGGTVGVIGVWAWRVR
jgi:hypothetical protein